MQSSNRRRSAGLDRISYRDNRGGGAVNGGVKRRFAFFAQRVALFGKRAQLDPFARHQAVGADQQHLALDIGLHA